MAIDSPKSGFAKTPDPSLCGQVQRVVIRVAETMDAEIVFDGREPRRQVFGAIGIELDTQHATGRRRCKYQSQRLERGALPRVVQMDCP